MFDLFKKKKLPGNVVPFPEPKSTPSMPKVEPPPEKEKPATVFYRFGITDNGRLAFNMGYSEITMNRAGVQSLIDQLEFYKERMDDGEGE